MSDRTAQVGERNIWRGRLIGAGVVIGVILLFVALNSEEVNVDLLVVDADIRLGWALLLVGALGFVAGLLFPRFRGSPRR
jgi:uncharacterized integral membrane protein